MKVRSHGRLRIALPWLESALRAEALEGRTRTRMPAGEWLVARGDCGRSHAGAWREWLLADLEAGGELLRRFPAGPCLRALHTAAPPEGTWGCARPVHLLTAIDHLQLAHERIVIDAVESARLIGDMNVHLEGSGLRLHGSGATGDWQLECTQPLECTSVDPDEASGRNLRDLMPGGRDGARVRSLMNEMQMLLHQHPVNTDRAGRGLPVINSLWLWGIGSVQNVSTTILTPLYTDDAWLAGLWRVHGTAAQAPDDFAAADGQGMDALVACARMPRTGWEAALTSIESACFAPARYRLLHRTTARISLLLGERAVGVDGRARYRVWRRQRPLSEAFG